MMPEKLAQKPPTSTTSPDAAEGEAEVETTPPPGDDVTDTEKSGAEDKDQTPPWLRKLISKTKEAEAAARRELAEARKQNAQLAKALEARAAPTPQSPTGNGEPVEPIEAAYADPAEYKTAMSKYTKDLAAWSAKRAIDLYDEHQNQERAEAEAARREEERQAFLEKGREKYDDFSERCEVDTLPITHVMFEAAKRSDIGEDVVYYLGTHTNEARRIAQLDPVAQVREMARIEGKLSKDNAPAPAKPTTKAPAPIKPVASKNAAARNPAEMSTEEYIVWVRSGRPAT